MVMVMYTAMVAVFMGSDDDNDCAEFLYINFVLYICIALFSVWPCKNLQVFNDMLIKYKNMNIAHLKTKKNVPFCIPQLDDNKMRFIPF